MRRILVKFVPRDILIPFYSALPPKHKFALVLHTLYLSDFVQSELSIFLEQKMVPNGKRFLEMQAII